MTQEPKTIIQAIYVAKCEQIQIAWLNPQIRQYIDDGLAFAASRRIYPYFHATNGDTEPFDDAYWIKESFVKEVIKYIDQFFSTNSQAEELQFYNLERHFGGHHINRAELITIIRYCSISDRFNEQTYKTIMSNAPIEAKNLTRKIDEQDISITS